MPTWQNIHLMQGFYVDLSYFKIIYFNLTTFYDLITSCLIHSFTNPSLENLNVTHNSLYVVNNNKWNIFSSMHSIIIFKSMW